VIVSNANAVSFFLSFPAMDFLGVVEEMNALKNKK